MIRILLSALTLLAACQPSAPSASTSEPVRAPPVPVVEAPPPEPELRNVWIADIRNDAAYLNFGYPNSGVIAVGLDCDKRAGFFTIGLPSVGKPEIILSSGAASETFPARIEEGTEGWEDIVESIAATSSEAPIFAAFRATGALSAAAPDRRFDATTPEERAEIEHFFVACSQIHP